VGWVCVNISSYLWNIVNGALLWHYYCIWQLWQTGQFVVQQCKSDQMFWRPINQDLLWGWMLPHYLRACVKCIANVLKQHWPWVLCVEVHTFQC
jgi:hypothetical protein